MKLRRILAASTAAAIVASAMAVTSFADEKAFSGSTTVKSTGGWWDQAEIGVTTLLGDINPADVTKIVVTTDNAASIQYNNTAAEYQKVDLAAGGSLEITDICLTEDNYFFAPAVSSGDTTYSANVSWDVYAEAAAADDTTGDEIVDGGDDVVDEGDSAVVPMEKPIVITNDVVGGDWGGDATVDYTALEQFEGDVLVTLDVALTIDDAHTYWMVAPANYWGWEKVSVTILDDTAYFQQPDGFINIEDNTTTQVQFVLGAAEVDALLASIAADETTGELAGGMLFQVYGADVTSVTLDDYVPAAEGDDIIDEGNAAVEGIDCVYGGNETPSYTCTVAADIDTLPVDVVYAPADGDAFNFNDWCGNGVIVTMADGTKTYYQWGGAQVSWGWDIDDDKTEESVGGVNGETWLGSVNTEDLTAQLSIPVEKGAVVEFYTLGWDAYEGTQYTLVIDEALITEGAAEDGDSAGSTEGADDENKNSADTGVEGIAVAAGALALAGAAVIASRKRK